MFNEDKASWVLLCKILSELISFSRLNSGISSVWIKSISAESFKILASIELKSTGFSITFFSGSCFFSSTICLPFVTLSIIILTSVVGCFLAKETIFSTWTELSSPFKKGFASWSCLSWLSISAILLASLNVNSLFFTFIFNWGARVLIKLS